MLKPELGGHGGDELLMSGERIGVHQYNGNRPVSSVVQSLQVGFHLITIYMRVVNQQAIKR